MLHVHDRVASRHQNGHLESGTREGAQDRPIRRGADTYPCTSLLMLCVRREQGAGRHERERGQGVEVSSHPELVGNLGFRQSF